MIGEKAGVSGRIGAVTGRTWEPREGDDAPAARPSPLVIAHRGASDLLAEHTLAAYEQAIADGADGLECDVRLTADGVLVCVHDRRIDRTSDGRGVVSAKSYSELAERDFGSWKYADAGAGVGAVAGPRTDAEADADAAAGLLLGPGDLPLRAKSGNVMALEQLLELVVEAPRPIDLAIETKHPVRYGGLVEDRVVSMVRRFGLEHAEPGAPTVRVMSFSEVAVRRMRALAPDIATVMLMDRVPLRSRSGWLPGGARIAGPGIHIVRAHPGYVARVHSAGSQVHVWTVNEPADIDLCIELGVDAIISNRPSAVLRRLGR